MSKIKKLGAYPDGISEFLLHGESLEQFRKENVKYIDKHICDLADEFCVEPEELLGCVLEYRIDCNHIEKIDNGEVI